MKKKRSAILMTILTGTIVLGAICIQTSHFTYLEDKQSHSSSAMIENPIKPDLKDLKKMGIEPFESNIPILMIDTKGKTIQKDDKKSVHIAIFDNEKGKNNIEGYPNDVKEAKIKLRGSNPNKYDKQQFRINFKKKHSKKLIQYDLFGMGKSDSWVLYAPYVDKSLMRNYLMYNLSNEIMEWAPECKYFEMFIDGKYEGVYLAIEPVTEDKERLNLSEFGLLSGHSPYILKRDSSGSEKVSISSIQNDNVENSHELSIQYPDPDYITKNQKKWIEKDIHEFETALYSDTFTDPKVGYSKYIDVDSFVDYFILNEFAMNKDAGELSTYVYKDLNGKLKMCVWDFNRSFNNYKNFTSPYAWMMTNNTWFNRLLQDKNFVKKVQERYEELRKDELSIEHIHDVMKNAQNELEGASQRNFVRWEDSLTDYFLNETEDEKRNANSYSEAVNMLEKTIVERLKFLDQSIPSL